MLAGRLSQEIVTYCRDKHPEVFHTRNTTKISLIGHSLGGLVIRKALEVSSNGYLIDGPTDWYLYRWQDPILAPLIPKLQAYVSLSSPHLGTLYAESQLISTGMWALGYLKLNRCAALKELILEDSLLKRHSSSLVYLLSKNNVFAYFQKIILISSPKDQYVPFYSARIQPHGMKSIEESKLASLIQAMAMNLLNGVDMARLYRIVLDNNVGDSVNVDSVIGRTAHICYLENMVVAMELAQLLIPFIVSWSVLY